MLTLTKPRCVVGPLPIEIRQRGGADPGGADARTTRLGVVGAPPRGRLTIDERSVFVNRPRVMNVESHDSVTDTTKVLAVAAGRSSLSSEGVRTVSPN